MPTMGLHPGTLHDEICDLSTKVGPLPAFFSPSLSSQFTLLTLLNAVSVDRGRGRLNGEREGGVKEARSVGGV